MVETIKRLYNNTKNKILVANAVKKGWISEDQYKQITGEDYTAD